MGHRELALADGFTVDEQLGDARSALPLSGSGAARRQALLAGEDLVAVGVPAVVEHSPVAVGPLSGDVVGGVHRPGREVQKEPLVRRDLLGVGDERGRLVDRAARLLASA
jgi:hypothetical protein